MWRLGSHLCPNGHRVAPSIATQGEEITCPVCGAHVEDPSAESFAFNSHGACPACHGLGVRSEVNESTLVPDPRMTSRKARCCRGIRAAGGCAPAAIATGADAFGHRRASPPQAV